MHASAQRALHALSLYTFNNLATVLNSLTWARRAPRHWHHAHILGPFQKLNISERTFSKAETFFSSTGVRYNKYISEPGRKWGRGNEKKEEEI